MNQPFYDVVIVGAGPAGNICAYFTAKAGLSTLVLEEHAAAGLFVNCTGIIGKEAFRRLNLPTEPIVSHLQAITFYAPSGRSFRYDPGEPLAHVVSRRQFDQALADLAQAEGAIYRYEVHARLIQIQADAVELRQREDDPEPIRARVCVLATGFGSNLPLQVGLLGPRTIVYGAQAEVEMDGLRDVEIYLGRAVAPEAFAWVVPLQPARARIGLIASKQAPQYFENLLRHPAIRHRIKDPKPKMLLSPVPTEPIDRSFADRVLVVGEAAGQVKTTTQGGIYYGMLCAAMAAEAIREAAKKDDFRAQSLQRYERTWTRTIGHELKAGLSLRELFGQMSDSQIDAMVELGARDDIIGLVKKLAQFDWHRKLIRSSLRLPALQEVARGGLW